jgi:predicted kinase
MELRKTNPSQDASAAPSQGSPCPPPARLTVICGNAGVGKTTLGREICKSRSGHLLLDIDQVCERLVVAGLTASGQDPGDRDSPSYKATYREPIHQTLFDLAKENLSFGLTVVVVAPFTKERRDPTFLDYLKTRCGVDDCLVVYLTCDDQLRRSRIVQRGNPRDALKLKEWDQYAAVGVDPTPPPFPHFHIHHTE